MHCVFHWKVPSSPQSATREAHNIKQRHSSCLAEKLGAGQGVLLGSSDGDHCSFFLCLDFSTVLCEEGSWEGKEQMAEIPDLP